MLGYTPFRLLAGSVGALITAFGAILAASFFAYQQPGSTPGIPTGPVGYYFVAFAGTSLIGWGGSLLFVARQPAQGRMIGSVSALVFTLMALVRMLAWVTGDYYAWLGEVPRIEAAIFLALALAFLWLRPAQDEPVAADVGANL